MNSSELILEKVSSEIHIMWMTWAKEVLKKEKSISKERINRWEKECFLPYQELSEKMKELDRKFARKIIKIVNDKRN